MSVLVFAVGVLVFLITVYGTVTVGGLLLTSRQLDEQPELEVRPDGVIGEERPLARSADH